MRFLIPLLLVAWVAKAQPPEMFLMSAPVGAAATWYPTNLTSIISWWVADNAQTNSSGQCTNLPDLWVKSFNLTATNATRIPSISNNWINGHSILRFDGSGNLLTNTLYTNGPTASSTQEVHLVIWLPPDVSSAWIFGSGPQQSHDQEAYIDSSKNIQMGNDVGKFSPGPYVSNRWQLVSFMMYGTNGIYLTNGTVQATGYVLGDRMTGFTLFGRQTLGFPGKGLFAEGWTCSATNDAAGYSNMWNYVKTKYGTSGF